MYIDAIKGMVEGEWNCMFGLLSKEIQTQTTQEITWGWEREGKTTKCVNG